MLQLNIEYLENEKNVNDIIIKVKDILKKRKKMYERYIRNAPAELKAPLEYYIANVATGYFGGKAPIYTVKQETNEKRKEMIKQLFDKMIENETDAEEMQMLIDYIRDYNDDPNFFYERVLDYMITGACYWLLYETTDNEIVYAGVSSLQSVAIYDYSTPVQKVGGIRIWQEIDKDGFNCDMVELTTVNSKRFYKNSRKQPEVYKEDVDQAENVNWDLLPFYAVENQDAISIFEPVLTLIDAYETLLINNKHTFQYNDQAKLKITGFIPQNPLMIQNENGDWIKNPERTKEDELILEAPTFYTPDESGDIAWIEKNINDSASENHKRTLIELILMISMIPSISEISTREKTATEIERSFFPLEQVLTRADKIFKKELLCMWENIIGRINIKKSKNYDFRNIQIELQRNLPTDKDSTIEMALKLRELLSDETIIKMLPFDFDIESEMAKKQQENEEKFEQMLNQTQRSQAITPTEPNEGENEDVGNVRQNRKSDIQE